MEPVGPFRRATVLWTIAIVLLLMPVSLPVKLTPSGYSQEGVHAQDTLDKPWYVDWARDTNTNHIDDELELVLASTSPSEQIQVLVDYDHRPTRTDLTNLEDKGAQVVYGCEYIDTVVVKIQAQRVYDLMSLANVVMAEADLKIERSLDSAEKAVGVDVIHGNWSYTGDGVVIGIVDTGIDTRHVGLNDLDDINSTYDPKVVAFYDAKNHPDVLDGSYPPYDDDGHGSHVSGIASGTGQGSEDYKYVGVAPGSQLVGIKVLGPSDNSESDALRGLEWARDNKARFNIRILSLSFGAMISVGASNDGTSTISRLCDGLVEDGFVIVVAAGNSGPKRRTIAPPGDAKEVITVGNIYDDRSLNPSSSRGPVGTYSNNYIKPDVCAPGTDIYSVQFNTVSNYTSMTGTSMSTPFVSGVVALMLQIDGTLSPPQVKQMLTSTAGGEKYTPFESTPNNDYGFGIIRPLDIVANMTNGKKPPQVRVNDLNPLVNGVVRLSGTASSESGSILTVEVEAGNGEWQPATGTENWQFDWDTNKAPNGQSELRFRAYDGNLYGVVARKFITVNNVLVNLSLPGNAAFSGNSTVRGTTWGLVITRVEAKIDTDLWKIAEDTSPKKNWASWEFSFTTKDLKAGKHTITARSYDGYTFTESKVYEFSVAGQTTKPLLKTPGFEVPLLLLVIVVVFVLKGSRDRKKNEKVSLIWDLAPTNGPPTICVLSRQKRP
jgi:subtilisin family serine protease